MQFLQVLSVQTSVLNIFIEIFFSIFCHAMGFSVLFP